MAGEGEGAGGEALALAEKAASRPEDPAAPGKFATSTLVTLGIGAVGGLIALIVVLLAKRDGANRALGGLAAAVLGLVALAGLIKLLSEALKTSPRDRTSPEKALKAYLGSIGQLRWRAAASCLSWSAKQGGEIHRPAMPDIDLDEGRFTISSGKDLAGYWNDFVGRFKSRGSRRLSYKVKPAKALSETVAVVPVKVGISLDLNTAALGGEARKRRKLMSPVGSVAAVCQWPVYRRDNLWYVLAAGLPEGAEFSRS